MYACYRSLRKRKFAMKLKAPGSLEQHGPAEVLLVGHAQRNPAVCDREQDMTRNRSKRLNALAWSLSGDQKPCPVPSAHDRFSESHYFLHQMQRVYHEPDAFRYSLHAFVQAIESSLELLSIETQNDARFSEYRNRFDAFNNRKEMQKFKQVRNAAVHRESLVPDSHVSVGWFKYGRPKLCLKMQINPLIPSLEILGRFRNSRSLVNLRRMWESEEVGVLREWRLQSVADEELLSVCSARFLEVAGIMREAHECAGGRFAEGDCGVTNGDFRTLLESYYFPEVQKAWEGSPTETISPLLEELVLWQSPSDTAEILHRVPKGSLILGCVGTHPLWEDQYLSAIIFSVDGHDIKKDTAVFLKKSEAKVRRLPQKPER
jgi:hypothetical protein